MNRIVVGLGYGDEGKGHFTNFVANKNALVVRFNGGPQAGHTVVFPDGRRHVFSHFGAGTLNGNPTFWSKYCPLSPPALTKEYEALKNLGADPRLWVDPLCPVITLWDILANRGLELSRGIDRHGSCGAGFGTCLERTETSPYKLFVADLTLPVRALKIKLATIREYYYSKYPEIMEREVKKRAMSVIDMDQWWVDQIKDVKIFLSTWSEIAKNQKSIVFEGAQGTLLDMDHGFFPHVTRSNTTCKNAISLLQEVGKEGEEVVFHGISRCYSTRHGSGPFPGSEYQIKLKNNEKETNVFNDFQKEFKTALWNIGMTQYALDINKTYLSQGLKDYRIGNVVTCLDQVEDQFDVIHHDGSISRIDKEEIQGIFEDCIFASEGPTSKDIKYIGTESYASWI